MVLIICWESNISDVSTMKEAIPLLIIVGYLSALIGTLT